jgi:hypothetical protein
VEIDISALLNEVVIDIAHTPQSVPQPAAPNSHGDLAVVLRVVREIAPVLAKTATVVGSLAGSVATRVSGMLSDQVLCLCGLCHIVDPLCAICVVNSLA